MAKLFSMVAAVICSMFFYISAEAAKPVLLSYFFQKDGGVVWTWFNPLDASTQPIHKFKNEPAALYWEKGGKEIRVIDQHMIISFSGAGTLLNDKPIALPQMLANEKPVSLWRDPSDHHLRIATWVSIQTEQVQDDKIRLSNGDIIPTMTNPEWGWHAVVRLFKQKGERWVIERTLATKSEAGDTPGLSVLKPFWNEEGHSNINLEASKYCASFDTLFDGRVCHDGYVEQKVKKAFYSYALPNCTLLSDGTLNDQGCDVATSGFVSCEDCNFDLFHLTEEGDSLHAIFPIFLKNKENDSFQRLPFAEKGQALIDGNGRYAFIESKEGVSVLDLMMGNILINAKGKGAFWLPSD
ncbi:MAG: hypothetical protein ACNI26_15875 [Terasakiella sp.]|uniref:hypothetical protein n=1 Tax=unclassified Terasakiella TaxID=2614952 RepID=UPI003B005871